MKKVGYLILMGMLLANMGWARRLHLEVGLKGKWLFEIGDNIAKAGMNYDDSKWEEIQVPGCWEDYGYPGYDGFAWYRIWVHIPIELQEQELVLDLGRIDDVDQVYVNGEYLDGSGKLMPNYQSAFNVHRIYNLPQAVLNFGKKNLIAVRVYDEYGCGGILESSMGIYSRPKLFNLLIDLADEWKFNIGDNLEWAEKSFDDQQWKTVLVPSKWSIYGYGEYDGYGWYRKEVVFSRDLSDTKLILTLGKIDDIDEIYFNGVRIGRTGQFPARKNRNHYGNQYQYRRFYFLPSHLIRWNQKNVIAVRVFDVWNIGGIWEGPVGIMTREEYLRFERHR